MISKRDKHYIEMCFSAARDLTRVGGARVVALLVYKQIHAWGQNQDKTHPLQAQYGRHVDAIFLHAEIDALRNMLRQLDPDDLRHCTLYIARAKHASDSKRTPMIYGEAKPCCSATGGCQAAIKAFRIKRVVYTTDDQTIEEMIMS